MSFEQTPREGIVRIDVRGKDSNTWLKVKPKLLKAVQSVLDTMVDCEEGTTVKDELREFTGHLLDFAKAKLAREGLQNHEIEARVRQIYATVETERAKARREHAEASRIEFQTQVDRLRLVLMTTRAIMPRDGGDDAILFGLQIEELLKSLKEFV